MNRGNNNLASSNLVDNVLIKFLAPSQRRETLYQRAELTLILLGAVTVSGTSSAFLFVPRGSMVDESTSMLQSLQLYKAKVDGPAAEDFGLTTEGA
jgi:hypothetical protein